ncbi:hypothetical protein Bca4012_062898 [Brassica carinata]
MIPMPPFTTMPTCQNEVACNVAMSSSPEPYDKDWVVGIKLLGKQLSFCRPHLDLRWTNIPTPFESWDTSKQMYSYKDERFYLLAPGGNYLCSWDLDFRKDKKPKFHDLVLHNLPHMPLYHRKRYTEYSPNQIFDNSRGPMVMVFREEETKDGRKNMVYTEDIGDLCIFISKSKDFCVTVTSCRLFPNSIFLNGRQFVTLNITNRTIGSYEFQKVHPTRFLTLRSGFLRSLTR